MFYECRDDAWGPVTQAGYGRRPYVRITMDDGRVFDGRVHAWTDTRVLVQWPDRDVPPRKVAWMTTHVQEAWADAEHVERIPRRESSWQDPYDDYQWFGEQGEL